MSFHNVRDSKGRFTSLGNSAPNRAVKLKKEKTLLSRDYLILDESQSMSRISRQTVSNINEYLDNLRTLSKKANIISSIVKFSDTVGSIRENDINNTEKWVNGVHYTPHGMTALFDALGKTIINALGSYNKGEQVVITLITDGEENHSRNYNLNSIRELVDNAKNVHNFTINFIGAGNFLDVQAVGQSMGIFAANTVNFDANDKGVNVMMNKLSSSRTRSLVNYANTGENDNIGFFGN